MVRNNDRAKKWRLIAENVSRWDLLNIILSTVECGIYFVEPDTVLVFTNLL